MQQFRLLSVLSKVSAQRYRELSVKDHEIAYTADPKFHMLSKTAHFLRNFSLLP